MNVFSRTILMAITPLICITAASMAQLPTVTLRSDTNTIRIGDQFHLYLEATHPKETTLNFPALPDTFSNMEVLDRSTIDTLPSAHTDSVIRRQVFLVTSFDSGYHVILPFAFSFNAYDTLFTEPLLIAVQSVQVDTTTHIRELKSQATVPYTWRDFLPWILGAIVLGLIIILVRKYLLKRKQKIIPEKPRIVRPAHEVAMEALKELQAAQLWQSGNHKGYHSALSDILRTFIENRWQVMAMEMTTDDILNNSLIHQLESLPVEQLKNTLELSDRVKFAKWVPIAHENEESLRLAFKFVENFTETEKESVT